MIEVYSRALNKSIQVERIIGKINGRQPGPTLVFFGGIHGNEPLGIFALYQVIETINTKGLPFLGNMYAIAGNLSALARGVRYIDRDLNRMWTKDNVTADLMPTPKVGPTAVEEEELAGILSELRKIRSENSGPFYFFDLHTTSGATVPHITVNDTLLNRKFALHFPVPVILGIEEYLVGPLLSYINLSGYIALGFESGQHDSLDAVNNHISFIYHSLGITGSLEVSAMQAINRFSLNGVINRNQVFEIIHHHKIMVGEKFVMKKGFANFQTIRKGDELSFTNGKPQAAQQNGKIFMPLYQDLGNDGFFVIKKIPYLFLKASSLFRKIRFDSFLTLLPGIQWMDATKKNLDVNQRVAKFFAKDFLHLMGYRVKQENTFRLLASKREDQQVNKRYKTETWVKHNNSP